MDFKDKAGIVFTIIFGLILLANIGCARIEVKAERKLDDGTKQNINIKYRTDSGRDALAFLDRVKQILDDFTKSSLRK